MSEATFEGQPEHVLGLDEEQESDLLSDLHDFMDAEEVQELNISTDEGFRITSKEQAGFFVRKLQELRAEADRINKTADTEIKRISTSVNAWREREIKKLSGNEEWLLGLLKEFAQQEVEGTTKRSVSLPFGTLQFKKQQDKFEYDDKSLLKCLKENPKLASYLKQNEPSPMKAEIKKVGTVKDGKLYVDGVEIQGVTVISQPETFDVK